METVKPITPMPFDWTNLGIYKANGRFIDQYPNHTRTFFSPVDKVHDVLVALLKSAQHSVVLNMYGFTDKELDDILIAHAQNPQMYLQISLDSTQYAGVAEKPLMQALENTPGTNVAIGRSTGGDISHLKVLIVDGLYTVSGSTNWSLRGEAKQDNVLSIQNDAILAVEYRAILDRNHTAMLQQMQAKKH